MSEIERAAKALNTNSQTVRILMDQKLIDIGYVVQHECRKRYIIVPELLQKEVSRREQLH